MNLFFICLVFFVGFSHGIFYDTYRGTVLSKEKLKNYVKLNNTFWCAINIQPCDPKEGRRIDGSCNNLDHPTVGAGHTPLRRLLPAVYSEGFEPKKTKSGEEMPLVRLLRTRTVPAGRIPSQVFTQLGTYYLVFMVGDIASIHDTVNYVRWTQYCCLPKGKTSKECTPIKVPEDDPVFRFTDIRCLNLTRPISFQSVGCVKNDTIPERIVSATPVYDLSHIYGRSADVLKNKRILERGLLKFEEENGRIWPPSKYKPDICILNEKPHETRCHDTPEDGTNSILGVNLFSIWIWRYHNYIADQLATLNSCWSDDQIFDTAREIVLATYLQILYYELLPSLMGKENLIRDKVISSRPGFRDVYDPAKLPKFSLEASYIWRYIHNMQESSLKMYDKNGCYVKEFPAVNLTLKTGYLAIDNNLDYLTQGSFRQASGGTDHVADFDMVGIGFGPLQRANDILASDLAKNRLFGFPPYVKYREYCTGRNYKGFESLSDDMDPEKIEILKDLYEHVEDIDLMVGIWSERFEPGSFVPKTFYCLAVEQLLWSMESDRFWYERPNRPNAFSEDQLKEIRKATVSRILCDVGDTVTHIQPHGFLRSGPKNKMARCEKHPKINLDAWRDNKCCE